MELGLLQREVSERLNITHRTYINWEKGLRSPEICYWPKIVNFLGYSPFPEPALVTLGERIVAKRRELGLSKKAAAQFLGINEQTISIGRTAV
jgi:DNA-binding XRE family transcriptional regulator